MSSGSECSAVRSLSLSQVPTPIPQREAAPETRNEDPSNGIQDRSPSSHEAIYHRDPWYYLSMSRLCFPLRHLYSIFTKESAFSKALDQKGPDQFPQDRQTSNPGDPNSRSRHPLCQVHPYHQPHDAQAKLDKSKRLSQPGRGHNRPAKKCGANWCELTRAFSRKISCLNRKALPLRSTFEVSQHLLFIDCLIYLRLNSVHIGRPRSDQHQPILKHSPPSPEDHEEAKDRGIQSLMFHRCWCQ